MKLEMPEVRGWVCAAVINSDPPWFLNPDFSVAEAVYVIGRRIRELTGKWPFSECTFTTADNPAQPYSPDFYLSFTHGDKVDPVYGYGKLAYDYCRRYVKDGKHY